MNRKRKPKKGKNGISGIVFICFGVGIVFVNIFPETWMLVILAVILVVAGLIIMKC